MLIELTVLSRLKNLNVTIAAELPVEAKGPILAIIRRVLDMRIPMERAALRLLWEFSEYADDGIGAVLQGCATYKDCAITVDFDVWGVYVNNALEFAFYD